MQTHTANRLRYNTRDKLQMHCLKAQTGVLRHAMPLVSICHSRSQIDFRRTERIIAHAQTFGSRSYSSSFSDSGSSVDDPAFGVDPFQPSKGATKANIIQCALKKGTLGLGFSAGGFLYCYHLGVLWELKKMGVLPDPSSPGAVKMAGASAGSLAIATFACGLDIPKSTQALMEFAADCRQNGTRGRLSPLLRDFLHAYLPDDAHERCRDLAYIAVTRVFPVWTPELVHRFHSKDDLVQALVTSCHIPFYANGQWMTKFRGRYYMDGGVASFIPSPPTDTVVKVCCLPVSDVLNKVKPTVQSYERVASVLDVSISPDAFEPWDYTYQQLLNWALLPAEEPILQYLIAKGRRDAGSWVRSLDLQLPANAAPELQAGQAVRQQKQAAKMGRIQNHLHTHEQREKMMNILVHDRSTARSSESVDASSSRDQTPDSSEDDAGVVFAGRKQPGAASSSS